MNPIIVNYIEPLSGGIPLHAQIINEHCATDNASEVAMLGLDRILTFMPRRLPQGAFDIHLLLYPFNVLRLTEAIVQAAMSLPNSIFSTGSDECQTWPALFAVPCALAKTQSGDFRVRMTWKIRASEDRGGVLLCSRYLILQWAKVVRKLQSGQSCQALGVRRATGVGIRLSASHAVNSLIQTLPDLLDDLAETGITGEVGALPDAMLGFCTSIRSALTDAACSPLYEEMREFILSADEVENVFSWKS